MSFSSWQCDKNRNFSICRWIKHQNKSIHLLAWPGHIHSAVNHSQWCHTPLYISISVPWSLSASFFLSYDRFIGANISTSASHSLRFPEAPFHQILFSFHHCYIPHHPFFPSTNIPPSLYVISVSVIALCLEVRGEAFITTDYSAAVCMCQHECVRVCPRCCCGSIFIMLTWDVMANHHFSSIRSALPSSSAAEERKYSDKLILIGFWFASKWGVAAS